MKSIKELNELNEKTEVKMFCMTLPFEQVWEDFDFLGDEIASGRGGALLRARYNQSPGEYITVKCTKTDLKGRLYWRNPVRGTIDRIEWEDGVMKEY